MYVELLENKEHGTKDYPYTQYYIRNAPYAFQIPVHWHREVEIIYIRQGRLDLTLNGTGYTGYPGDVFFVNSGELHYMGSEDLSVAYYTILFPLDFISFRTSDGLEEEVFMPLRNGSRCFSSQLPKKELQKKVVKILEKLIAYNENKKETFKQIHTRMYLLEILELMWKENCILEPKLREQDLLQRELLTFVQQHYTEKITLQDLAEEFHMSEKYISRYFKTHFALNFKQYTQHLRLNYAKELLESSELSVLDVALNAGFPSVHYFIRRFHDIYGITPLQYRKRCCSR